MCKDQELYDFLVENHKGKDNAVRTYINKLRKSGLPICSDDSGYWIATNPREVNKTVKRLGDFAGEVNNARTGLAYANIQMRSVTRIREENIQIPVKVV